MGSEKVKQLTIVVPSYNMEKYLGKALDSMICPEIMDELDVVIVNDGSTDRTAEVAGEYVKKYPGTFRLFNKPNGGHGSGLNLGIARAKGRYVRPIDADDWVDTSVLKILIESLRKINSDMVLTNFKKVHDDTGKTESIRLHNVFNMKEINEGKASKLESAGKPVLVYGRTYDFGTYMYDFFPQYLYHFITYRTELLRKNHVRFTEHCAYDDMEYDTYPMKFVKTVTPIDRYLYYYRLGREGQSVTGSSFVKHRNERKKIVVNVIRDVIEHKSDYPPSVYLHLIDESKYRAIRQYQIYFYLDSIGDIRKECMAFDGVLKSIDRDIYRLSSDEKIDYLRKHDFSRSSVRKIKKHIEKLEEYNRHRPPAWSEKSDPGMHRMIRRRSILAHTGLWVFSKQMRDIREYKNIHEGERCFITCTGPSLTMSDLDLLRNENTIGVNSIIEAYRLTSWRPSYYIMVDFFAFADYVKNNRVEGGMYATKASFFHYRLRPLTTFGKQLFIPINYSNHFKKSVDNHRIRYSKELSVCCYDGFTVTNAAIQLAMYMGFKEIYLLGCDCNYTTKQIHFVELEDDQKKIQAGWLPHATDLSIEGYKAIKEFADKQGVKIFNATRGGCLEVFPRVNLDDVVEGKS